MSNSNDPEFELQVRRMMLRWRLGPDWKIFLKGVWHRQFCSVDRILDGMLSEKKRVRKLWKDVLWYKQLKTSDLLRIVERLGDPYPEKTESDSTTQDLLCLLGEPVPAELLPLIVGGYDKLVCRVGAQQSVLRLVLTSRTSESMKVACDLLERSTSEDFDLSFVMRDSGWICSNAIGLCF